MASHGQAGVQSGKPSFILRRGDFGRQTPSLLKHSPSFFFPQIYMLSMMPYSVGNPFGQLGSASLLCPLSAPSVPPACSLVGWDKELGKGCSAITKPCVINIVSSTKLNHSPMLPTINKFTLSQTKPAKQVKLG